MQATVEKLEENQVKLSITLDHHEWDHAIEHALSAIGSQVRIPGFRPGKAPRGVLEKRFGAEVVREEAVRHAMPEVYTKAVIENEIDVVAAPKFDVTSTEADATLTFEAIVETRPTVSVPGYSGLQVTVANPNVSDEEFERQLTRFREQFASLVEADRPAIDGDVLTIDIETMREGEVIPQLTATAWSYELGTEGVVPTFDEQLRGKKAGETVTFDADAPADGLPLQFEVKLEIVQEKQLADFTDQWVTENSEFKTVEELKTDMRTRLNAMRLMQINMSLRDKVLESLCQLVAQEVPESMVESEMERALRSFNDRLTQQGADLAQWMQATNRSQEDLIAEFRTQGELAVKADLALRAVSEAEKLEADDDEVDIHIEQLAERMKEKVNRVRQAFERNGQMPSVRWDVRKGKALDWLIENVEYLDEEGGASIPRSAFDPVLSEDEIA